MRSSLPSVSAVYLCLMACLFQVRFFAAGLVWQTGRCCCRGGQPDGWVEAGVRRPVPRAWTGSDSRRRADGMTVPFCATRLPAAIARPLHQTVPYEPAIQETLGVNQAPANTAGQVATRPCTRGASTPRTPEWPGGGRDPQPANTMNSDFGETTLYLADGEGDEPAHPGTVPDRARTHTPGATTILPKVQGWRAQT